MCYKYNIQMPMEQNNLSIVFQDKHLYLIHKQ